MLSLHQVKQHRQHKILKAIATSPHQPILARAKEKEYYIVTGKQYRLESNTHQAANLNNYRQSKKGALIAKAIIQFQTIRTLIRPPRHPNGKWLMQACYIWHRSKQIREYNQASDKADILKVLSVT